MIPSRVVAFLLIFMMSAALSTTTAAIRILEDVDSDGRVDVCDLNAVINVILNLTQDPVTIAQANVTGDQQVDVEDVNAVINSILTGDHHELRTGYDYVWNYQTLPEIHIDVTVDEWDKLLDYYDADRLTKEYISVDVTYITGNDTTIITDVGLRMRGNSSRRRPEGVTGEHHMTGYTVWHPTGFGLNFRKYHKDEQHTLQGIRKINLRYFYHDPTYVRELFCYRLLSDFGVWTAPRDTYCRLWIHVLGDTWPAYYGVYTMVEPFDEEYLKDREDLFGSSDGYLWKCGKGEASLTNVSDQNIGIDKDELPYVLKTRINEFTRAKEQFMDLVNHINTPSDEDFAEWISTVCDVPFLLRSYAVVVAVGSWDDYWNTSNNYYLYFTTTNPSQYKFFFIPYDLDNTLGSSRHAYGIIDSGRQDPLHWGRDEHNPLIARILKIAPYRQLYIDYLKQLVNADHGLMHFNASTQRIKAWHEIIAPYVPSVVDRDNILADLPSKLGNMPLYRLLEDDEQWNFFRVRAAVIDSIP
ncbi:MAG: CotH kinase family protein [Muribaculaceae bacterium]|nr:CotH kinase family protein [Muribaculaceae bacterium]